ncbi:choline transporter-like (slc family 44) [Anaeramoeba ignava]|uniref:Choline transporter-like protein n=1 Tax=Anaeramoeba ignava TaxID=1746090 RepID=A0A9Q0LGQ4_ANAIG|nr:choline transporter-like (slc family 44) [Anaeramoeba ignava]
MSSDLDVEKQESKQIDSKPDDSLLKQQNQNEYEYDDSELGPTEKRKCRDFFWVVLFILFWIGMLIVMAVAFSKGSPKRLYYPTDYRGNVCGFNNKDVKDQLKKDGYSDLDVSFLQDLTDKTHCFFPYDDTSNEFCVSECPSSGSFSSPPCSSGGVYDYYTSIEHCNYESESHLRRCIPTSDDQGILDTLKKDVAGSISVTMGDLAQSWWIMLVTAGIALVLSFIWFWLMKKFSGFMIWLTVFALFVVLIIFTWYLWKQVQTSEAKKTFESDKTNAKWFKVLFSLMVVVDFVFVLLVIFLRNRIRLAAGIIREAAKAISAIPSLVFFPFWTFLMLLVLYLYWIPVTLFLMSAGKPTLEPYGSNSYKLHYKNDTSTNYATIYHLFGLLWTTLVIIALTQATIAGAVSSWYWARDKHNLPKSPVMTSFKRMLRYHFGSLCFGSFLIAVVQLIRMIIRFIEKQLKKRNLDNKCVKYCFYCMKCFFACLESWLKFISRNAYIMIAVYGESFCKSTKRAFHLIARNIIRIMVLNVFGDLLLWIGKIIVTIISTMIAISILRSRKDISFYLIPALVCALLSYGIASAFMAVFEMAIDTIFLSFCEDSERHDGSSPDKEPYATEDLRKYMNEHKPKEKEKENL